MSKCCILTSFKIAQIFETSKFSKYLTASSSSTDLHEKGSAFPAKMAAQTENIVY